MKFSITAVMGLLMAEQAAAFAPHSPLASRHANTGSSGRSMTMAADMPPVVQKVDLPVVQRNQNGPTDVRYSEFLNLVDTDRVEKVTFSSDGTQLLGVDVDGSRLKIESLPNDPELLNKLTSHKVRVEIP
jgi:cell division protease FtsH